MNKSYQAIMGLVYENMRHNVTLNTLSTIFDNFFAGKSKLMAQEDQ